MWENLGPMHQDRIGAAAARYPGEVGAIQFWPNSDTYAWAASEHAVPTQTLMPHVGSLRGPLLAWRLLRACWRSGARDIYLCHYQLWQVFVVACVLRLAGRRPICMIESKFDDYTRHVWRELGKWFLLLPYRGALVGVDRHREYLRFLGLRRRPIALGCDALSVERIRAQAPGAPAPAGAAHADRDFVVIARLVAKKNLDLALDAFAGWRSATGGTRKLRFLGSGPCEDALRARAAALGIADGVVFEGFVQTDRVSAALSRALCLILPSTEEQFGLVVIEAMAMGVPALVSWNAGAVDTMIDNGINGWIIDPRSPRALAAAMTRLDRNADEWAAMARAAGEDSWRGDSAVFADGVVALSGPPR